MSDKNELIEKIKKNEKDFNNNLSNIKLSHKKRIQKILDEINLRKIRKKI